MAARASKRHKEKIKKISHDPSNTSKKAKRHRNPENFPENALRARRFAPGSGGSVAHTLHIFCRLG
jgi:hypothetical protein